MDWLKYIPVVGSVVGGIADLFGSGDSPDKPKVQRPRPTFIPPQAVTSPTPTNPAPAVSANAAQNPGLLRLRAVQEMMARRGMQPPGMA